MKKELEDKLFSIHSLLFAQRHLSGSVTRMCDGICVSDGWYDLMNSMCEELQALSDKIKIQIEFVQIKSKFAGLRVHLNNHSDEARAIIHKYEAIASRTCEQCKSTETVNIREVEGYWMETLCDKCYADRQNK